MLLDVCSFSFIFNGLTNILLLITITKVGPKNNFKSKKY